MDVRDDLVAKLDTVAMALIEQYRLLGVLATLTRHDGTEVRSLLLDWRHGDQAAMLYAGADQVADMGFDRAQCERPRKQLH